jgi:hypothetical protein
LQHELYVQLISPEKRAIQLSNDNENDEMERGSREASATSKIQPKQTIGEDDACSQALSHPTTIYKLDEGIFDFVSTCKSTSLETASSSRTYENVVTVVNMLVSQVNEHERQIHRINGCIEKMLLVLQNKN